MIQKSKTQKKVSPRKDSSKYQSILKATRELVDEIGYRAISLKAISSRAGVSRNVLYNWWDGDLNLIVEEAILPNVVEWPIPNTGSLEEDLTEFIEKTIDVMHRPNVLAAYLELASHVVDEPEGLQRVAKKYRAPYARLLGKILQKAEISGELPTHNPDTDLHYSIVAQMISGCVLQFAISKKPGRRNAKAVLVKSILKLLT